MGLVGSGRDFGRDFNDGLADLGAFGLGIDDGLGDGFGRRLGCQVGLDFGGGGGFRLGLRLALAFTFTLGGSLDGEGDSAELVGVRQLVEGLQAEGFEELGGRLVEQGAARSLGAPGELDEAALEEGRDDAVDGDAADGLDIGAEMGWR